MAKNIKGRKFVATAASAALVASAIVPVASAAEFADQSKISSWAADAVAHAVEKGYMQGNGGNFDPKGTVTKAQVAQVVYNALGLKPSADSKFSDVPAGAWYADAVNALAAEGFVTGTDKGTFEPNKPVTLAEAAVMLVNALGLTGEADLSKFADASSVPTWANSAIQALVAGEYIKGGTVNGKLVLDPLGNLNRERFATFFVAVAIDTIEKEEVTPEVKVLGATALNLKQVAISFDKELDDTTASTLSNYTFDGAALTTSDSVTVLEDAKTVVLTLATPVANQSTKKVTVKNVQSKAGATIEDFAADVTFADFQAPTVVDVASAGPDSFKVKFSEPVSATALATANYSINKGQYFIQSVTQTGLNEVVVKLYSTLPEGTYDVEIKDVTDLAGFKVATTTKSFTQVIDTAAPAVARVVSASPEKVVLEFTEDIIANDFTLTNVYHTNTKNTPDSIVVNPNNSKQLVLTFTTNELPQGGTAYLVVKKDVVKDGWNNKNAEYAANISVNIDTVKPTVTKLVSGTDKSFELTFSEEITKATAEVASNYTVLDPTGKKVDATFTAKLSGTGNNVVTLTTTTVLPGGQYTVVVENVKDLAGNTIEKVSNVTTVKDTTAPTVKDAGLLYPSKNIAKVEFSEAMATSGAGSVLDLSNYSYGGKFLNTTKATITVTDNGKAVLIDFSKTDITLTSGDTINVGKVSDVTGNSTTSFQSIVKLSPANTVGIASATATGPKTVVVNLEDSLAKFVASDFEIKSNDTVITPASVTFANVDGKGQITFTLKDALEYDAEFDGKAVTVTTIAAPTSENAFGVKVEGSISAVTVTDKIAPTVGLTPVDGKDVANVSYSTTGTVTDNTVDKGTAVEFTITYTEAIDPDTVSKLGFTVAGYTVSTVVATGDTVVIKATANAKTTVLTSIVQVNDIADIVGNVLKASNTYTVVRAK